MLLQLKSKLPGADRLFSLKVTDELTDILYGLPQTLQPPTYSACATYKAPVACACVKFLKHSSTASGVKVEKEQKTLATNGILPCCFDTIQKIYIYNALLKTLNVMILG